MLTIRAQGLASTYLVHLGLLLFVALHLPYALKVFSSSIDLNLSGGIPVRIKKKEAKSITSVVST